MSDDLKAAFSEFDRIVRDDGDLHAAWSAIKSAIQQTGLPSVTRTPDRIDPALGSLAFDAAEALSHMAIARAVNARLLTGYYKERLVALATQEKSSSTLHEVAINEMLRRSGGISVFVPTQRQDMTGPTQMAGGSVFHPGMLMFVPNGGVLRGVFDPTRDNVWHLREIGCRTVILTRHPADRFVAQYCMRKGELDAAATKRNSTPFRMAMHDIDLPRIVHPLLHNLRWLGGWVARKTQTDTAGPPRELIVRYEDMTLDPLAHFDGIHRFLYGAAMDDNLRQAIGDILASSGEGGALQSGNASTRVYEKGYSGKVGVWKDYFAQQDIDDFNSVVRRFIDSDPLGQQALSVYPDLLLDSL